MNVYFIETVAGTGDLRVKLLSKNSRITTEVPEEPNASTSRAGSPASSTVVEHPASTSTDLKATAKAPMTSRTHAMFGDEEVNPFFRRLAFSTDGSLLVTPAGIVESSASSSSLDKKGKRAALTIVDGNANTSIDSKPKPSNGKHSNLKQKKLPAGTSPTVYLFARGNLQNESPAAHLAGHRTSSIVVRFNPILWDLREKKSAKGKEKAIEQSDASEGTAMEVDRPASSDVTAMPSEEQTSNTRTSPVPGTFALKKRSIYAVATHETILIYDTQQTTPICMFGSLHFAAFTDLAW